MSTPIGQLGIGNEQQHSFDASMQQMEQGQMNPPSDASMMNQVLDRVQGMDDDPHSSNINGEMMNHNMDPSQIPPEQQYEYAQEEPMQYHQPQMEEQNDSWTEKIQTGVKGPFIVFILAFLINLPHITRMLTHFAPKLLYESGQLNIYGVAVKAILVASLYGVIAYATN